MPRHGIPGKNKFFPSRWLNGETAGKEFVFPQNTMPWHVYRRCAILLPLKQLYYYYFILLLNYRAIFDTSAKKSEAHMLKVGIKNCSIVNLPYRGKQNATGVTPVLIIMPLWAKVHFMWLNFIRTYKILITMSPKTSLTY